MRYKGFTRKQKLGVAMGEREILFKGKRFTDNEWLYGSLRKEVLGRSGCQCFKDCDCINRPPETRYTIWTERDGVKAAVRPDSIGQYTGLNDKNGTRIFEGDVLGHRGVTTGYVIFASAEFMMQGIKFKSITSLKKYTAYIEVIGNIHDNPELLKVV